MNLVSERSCFSRDLSDQEDSQRTSRRYEGRNSPFVEFINCLEVPVAPALVLSRNHAEEGRAWYSLSA